MAYHRASCGGHHAEGVQFLGAAAHGTLRIPDTFMTASNVSRAFAVSLAALTLWWMVSVPGMVDPEFAGSTWFGLVLALAVIFGLVFVALRFSTGGTTVFWSGSARTDQVGHILLMIGVALVVHMCAVTILHFYGLLDKTSRIVGLLSWTLVPAAFVASGLVEWPRRIASASARRLILTGVVALVFAAAYSYVRSANELTAFEQGSPGDIALRLAGIVGAAASEEVVCRILLLTALLELTRSRFNAVFVSSVIFGLVHAPLYLLAPFPPDWATLHSHAVGYAPQLLLQIFLGLVLGVLWLRTGSVILIVATHAAMNI